MSRRRTTTWMGIALAAGIAAAACRKERVPPADAGAASTPALCDQLWRRAQRELAAALPSARPCKADTDCEVVDTVACLWGCGDEAIPKTAVPAVVEKRKDVQATTCKTWQDADCMRLAPVAVPSCAVPSAVCRDGACAMRPWAPPR